MEAVSLAVGLVTTRLSSFPDPACTFNDWVKGRFMPLLCMTDSKYVVLYTVHVFSSCIEALCFQWPDPPTPDCLDSKSPELHRAVCVRFLLHFEVDITRAVS